jgi:hypothetical protein
MNEAALLAGIRDGNFHAGGIRCLRVFQVEPAYFAELSADINRLWLWERASDVNDPKHVTNWTRPRGGVIQFSLFNTTGRYDDFSTDHDMSCLGKKFHGAAQYSAVGDFVSLFPHTVNARINVMSAGARLTPHEENAVIRTRAGSIGARVRFHLPITSNPDAELMLDGSVYHLTPGMIYFINHGCVHSACNRGEHPRIHLVWDMLLTRDALDFMFGNDSRTPRLLRIAESDQNPAPIRTERVGPYLRLPSSVARDEADRLVCCDVQ